MKPRERTFIISGLGRPGEVKRITVRELVAERKSASPRKPKPRKVAKRRGASDNKL